MNIERHIYEGKEETEILNLALYELNVKEDQIIKKVEDKTTGGLFKTKKKVLTIIKKEDIIEAIKELIIKITSLMQVDVKMEVLSKGDSYNIVLHSDNNNILIGKEGKNIRALFVLLREAVNNEIGFTDFRFTIDVGSYQKNNEKRLIREAKKIAYEVKETKTDVEMDPMNSYERRLIHNALNKIPNISTTSIGEGSERHIVIKYIEDQKEEAL